MNDLVALTRAQWRSFWRDKQNWFWLLAFPLMFLVLFGSLFSDAGAGRSELAVIGDVALIEELPPDAAAGFEDVFEVVEYDDRAAALEAVSDGDLDAAVEQEGEELVHRWVLRPGAEVPAGEHVFAAQYDHPAGGHEPGYDRYLVRATAADGPLTAEGGFR